MNLEVDSKYSQAIDCILDTDVIVLVNLCINRYEQET